MGGQQCARCVGLGQGPSCEDVQLIKPLFVTYSLTPYQPPEELKDDVHALIKLLPQYNQILLGNPQDLYNSFTDREKAVISKTVKASEAFKNHLGGLRVCPP